LIVMAQDNGVAAKLATCVCNALVERVVWEN
jgi:hypothetical protein